MSRDLLPKQDAHVPRKSDKPVPWCALCQPLNIIMPVVLFAQFSSIVQPTFWHELSRLKLEVLRLSDDSVNLTASYSSGRTIKDRNTGQEVALSCNITVGGKGLLDGYR